MWSTLYSLLSVTGLLQVVRRPDGYVGKSEAVFICGHLRVWCGCDKVVDAERAEAWDI